MEINYSEKALLDLKYWRKSGNKSIQKKISSLIDAIVASPYHGVGQVEALKYELTGKWSRRINAEHRIVYDVLQEENILRIHSLRGHYD